MITVTMEMLRYLSDPDCPAPGTLCGIQEPELAEISSSDVAFWEALGPLSEQSEQR